MSLLLRQMSYWSREEENGTQKNYMDFFDLSVNKSDKKQENTKQMNHCGYVRCIPDILLPFSLYLVTFFHTFQTLDWGL